MDNKKVDAKIRFLSLLKRKGEGRINEDSRLPKGQTLLKEEHNFPVLDLGVQPVIDMKKWKLEVFGKDVGIKKTLFFTLEELKKIIGEENYTKDFHCVTRWSKYDIAWKGIPLQKLIDYLRKNHGLNDEWKHLIQYGYDEYSTNVTREDLEKSETFIAFELEGKEIPTEHGKIRIIIPHLYGWKGSKFLKALEFSKEDKQGFWETRGYHNRGDVILEERYS